jgi:hypothetical protein
LLATIKAIYAKENRSYEFQAAIQGVDIKPKEENNKTNEDVTKLKGYSAREAGFGINMGLGHHVEE